jgi:hypothetical protein
MPNGPRRVVIGNHASGASVVVADGHVPCFADTGEGQAVASVMWSTDGGARLPYSGTDPTLSLTMETMFPRPGGSRLMIVRHPPGAGVPATAAVPAATQPTGATGDAPGDSMGDATGVHFDETGMHASDTVDYIVVVSGTICMELDHGTEVELSAGDVLIQNGTRHGWRNRSDADAVVAVVLLGASVGA